MAKKVTDDQALRDHLMKLLDWQDAHANFDAAVAGWPGDLRGIVLDGAAHSGWQILEHLRICQWDILEFSRDPKHVSPEWPAGYWPEDPALPSEAAWDKSVAAFRGDLGEMKKLVADPATDLFRPIPHGDGQTVLREALLLADHNAYHLGELVVVRRLLGAWHA